LKRGFALSEYDPGGREVTATNLLLLISEMEGTYQHLKYMGFEEDRDIIDKMKKTYYKLYFKKKKEESVSAAVVSTTTGTTTGTGTTAAT